MAQANADEFMSDDSDLELNFIAEGPQPYNFEPTARRVVQSTDYEKLSGVRKDLELWARDNVDRIGTTNWGVFFIRIYKSYHILPIYRMTKYHMPLFLLFLHILLTRTTC